MKKSLKVLTSLLAFIFLASCTQPDSQPLFVANNFAQGPLLLHPMVDLRDDKSIDISFATNEDKGFFSFGGNISETLLPQIKRKGYDVRLSTDRSIQNWLTKNDLRAISERPSWIGRFPTSEGRNVMLVVLTEVGNLSAGGVAERSVAEVRGYIVNPGTRELLWEGRSLQEFTFGWFKNLSGSLAPSGAISNGAVDLVRQLPTVKVGE